MGLVTARPNAETILCVDSVALDIVPPPSTLWDLGSQSPASTSPETNAAFWAPRG